MVAICWLLIVFPTIDYDFLISSYVKYFWIIFQRLAPWHSWSQYTSCPSEELISCFCGCFCCYCCCIQSALLGFSHNALPTSVGCSLNIIFSFPSPSVLLHLSRMCHLQAVVCARVQFSKPSLHFLNQVPHMLSSGVSSNFKHKFMSSFTLPLTSPWFSHAVSQSPFLDPLPTLGFLPIHTITHFLQLHLPQG